MDDGLKQRLIGAIVLVISAVIFIPMIFDESTIEPEQVQLDLPARPEFAAKLKPQPSLVLQSEPVPDHSASESNAPTVLAKTPEQSQAEGWVIQMGAFREQKNAESLRDKLRAAKHKAYIQYRPDNTPALYRVYVGPKIQWADIESLRNKLLKQNYQLDDIKIVRYLPELSL